MGLSSDPDRLLSDYLFTAALKVAIGLTIVLSLFYGVCGLHSAALGQFLIAIGSTLALMGLRQLENRVLLSNMVIASLFVMAWFRFYSHGYQGESAFFIYIFIPIFTMSFLPTVWAFFWTIAFLALYIGFQWVIAMEGTRGFRGLIDGPVTIRIFSVVLTNFMGLSIVYNLKTTYRKIQKILIKEKEDKTNLLRIVTHDLANPLTILSLHIEKLHKQNPNKNTERALRAKEMMKTIIDEARHLESLLSGKCPLRIEKLQPSDLVEQIKFLQTEAMNAKSIKLQVNYHGSEDQLAFYGDRSLVVFQILNNLVSNAVKFSFPQSAVKIVFFKINDLVFCEVIDSGIGMEPLLIKKLFCVNAQTTRLGTNGELGTGFGMPIVKACVERLGGAIEVESRTAPPSGTLVRVSFPCRKD
jgi:signal transduction histidine kinase